MKEEQDLVIPLVEEHVSTSKRTVESGRVRVSTEVERYDELVRVELARDEIDIERVPKDVEISTVPDVRQEGEVTIVPIVEERLVVEKKLVLVEELHLTRRRSSEEIEQPVTLARQRARVEREQSGGGQSETANHQQE